MRRWVLLGLVGWASAALGAAPVEVHVIHQKDRTVYRKKTVVSFDDVTLDGELVKPEGAYVLDREKTHFKTLVKVRKNFSARLRASADDL